MRFILTLTISHESLPEPKEHLDIFHAKNKGDVINTLDINNKQKCDLRSFGKTYWQDTNGAAHTLELKQSTIEIA